MLVRYIARDCQRRAYLQYGLSGAKRAKSTKAKPPTVPAAIYLAAPVTWGGDLVVFPAVTQPATGLGRQRLPPPKLLFEAAYRRSSNGGTAAGELRLREAKAEGNWISSLAVKLVGRWRSHMAGNRSVLRKRSMEDGCRRLRVCTDVDAVVAFGGQGLVSVRRTQIKRNKI